MKYEVSEILETIKMNAIENLDVRTVTMGISLFDCIDDDIIKTAQNIREKMLRYASNIVPVANKVAHKYGVKIVNKRISLTPLSLVFGKKRTIEEYVNAAQIIDTTGKEIGVDFIGGYSALVHKGITESEHAFIESIPHVLSLTDRLCSSVNVATTKAGINMDAVMMMGDIVKKTAEMREHLAHTPYEGADIISVSAKTGLGIADLKGLILENLRKLSKAPDSDKPYLYIDRVFSPKGVGTVVTGTLKNGVFKENDQVVVLPSKKYVKIKKIESHYRELQEGVPSQRTALNLSGINMEELKRGDLVCRQNFFTETDDVIASFRPVLENKKIRNNSYVEILSGTNSSTGKIIVIGDINEHGYVPVRIRFDEKNFFYPGQPFVLTNPGGYRIIGGGKILLPEYIHAKHKKSINEYLHLIKTFEPLEIFEFNIACNGYLRRDILFSIFPFSKRFIERFIDFSANKNDVVVKGDLIFWKSYLADSVEKIKRVVYNKLGPNLKEIIDSSMLPGELVEALIKDIINEETLIEKEGRFFTPSSITRENLPDSKKRILAAALEKKGEGLELDKIKNDIEKKEIKDLIKLNFLISLDGNIIYHKDVYEEMKIQILSLFDSKDKITVPEAKDAVSLSRKYILPLLNKMESDGLIKRLGDFRIKV